MSQVQNRRMASLLGAPASSGDAPVFSMGALWAEDNSAVTTIPLKDTWTDLNLNALAVLGAGVAQWSLSDSTTGELTYDGVAAITTVVVASISGKTTNNIYDARFRIVKNGVGVGGNIEQKFAAGVIIRACPIVASLTLVTGDTVRVQMENGTNANNAVIASLNLTVKTV